MLDSLPYLPILDAKLGETFALGGVSPARRGSDIRPLLIIPPEPSIHLIPRLRNRWGIDRFFADVSRSPARAGKSILLQMREAELRPIPVIAPNQSLNHLTVARDFIATANEKRVCLRLPGHVAAASDCEPRLRPVLEAVGLRPKSIDLVLEFGSIDPRFALEIAVRAIECLPRFEDWRSITFSASSFPQHIRECKGYEEIGKKLQMVVLARPEWEIYQKLVGAGFSRPIGFSDTGVTFIGHDDEGGSDKRPAPNLRYTCDEGFVILRGDYDKGNEDMHRICRAVIKLDGFKRDYSAGDEAIYQCATGGIKCGHSPTWRQWDLNHHFEFMMDRLATLV